MKTNYILIIICLVFGNLYAGFVLVKKKSLKVFKQPSRQSDFIKKVYKKDMLKVLGKSGLYWKVKVENKIGYVSILGVRYKSNKNPKINERLLLMVKNEQRNSLPQAHARSVHMGVRGLNPSDVSKASHSSINLNLLNKMESIKITDKDLDKFSKAIYKEIIKKNE